MCFETYHAIFHFAFVDGAAEALSLMARDVVSLQGLTDP